jgi:hypothetical protein
VVLARETPVSRRSSSNVPATRSARCGRRLHRGSEAGSDDDDVLHRPQGGSGSSRHAALGVDVLDVVVGRLRRDVQPIRDLSRRESPRDKAQHLDLAARQSAGVLAPAGLPPTLLVVTGRREDCFGLGMLEYAF